MRRGVHDMKETDRSKNRTHIFIDTETTGLGPFANPRREDAIVEVGIAYRINGRIERWGSLCNPGEKYFRNGRAEEALRVNQISLQDIADAPDSRTASMGLRSALKSIGEVELHAYNIPFDKAFLDLEPWNISMDFTWGEDVMDLSFNYFQLPQGYKIGLARTLERLGIRPDGDPHRAATDAVSALMAYERMRDMK